MKTLSLLSLLAVSLLGVKALTPAAHAETRLRAEPEVSRPAPLDLVSRRRGPSDGGEESEEDYRIASSAARSLARATKL